MSSNKNLLESQIREIYGRVVYTHKTHEKCADILKCRYDLIRFIDIALSVVTTSSIIIHVFGDNDVTKIISLISSALLLGLKLFSYNYNLLALSEKHKNATLNILEIREKLLSLIVDINIGNIEIELLQKKEGPSERSTNKYI